MVQRNLRSEPRPDPSWYNHEQSSEPANVWPMFDPSQGLKMWNLSPSCGNFWVANDEDPWSLWWVLGTRVSNKSWQIHMSVWFRYLEWFIVRLTLTLMVARGHKLNQERLPIENNNKFLYHQKISKVVFPTTEHAHGAKWLTSVFSLNLENPIG